MFKQILLLVVIVMSVFANDYNSKVAQFMAKERCIASHCANTFNECVKDQACKEVLQWCKDRYVKENLDIFDCLAQVNSAYANKMIECGYEVCE